MSTKKTPKQKTKSAPKKRVKVRDGATLADYLERYLERIGPASAAAEAQLPAAMVSP
jgi:hypothetical protein